MSDSTPRQGAAKERLFIGVPLTDAVRDAVSAFLARGPALPGRVVPRENWHLTLKFLGPTTTAQRDAVAQGLQSLAHVAPFDLELAGFGGFPRPRSARVLWLGTAAGTDRLATLAERVDEITRAAGIPRETRLFHAHLTLSRPRTPIDARPLLEAFAGPICTTPVTEVTLFASLQTGRGSRYEPRAIVPLRGSPEMRFNESLLL